MTDSIPRNVVGHFFVFYQEFDETRICENLQIPLCFGTASFDAMDELEIMRLLGHRLEDYVRL